MLTKKAQWSFRELIKIRSTRRRTYSSASQNVSSKTALIINIKARLIHSFILFFIHSIWPRTKKNTTIRIKRAKFKSKVIFELRLCKEILRWIWMTHSRFSTPKKTIAFKGSERSDVKTRRVNVSKKDNKNNNKSVKKWRVRINKSIKIWQK